MKRGILSIILALAMSLSSCVTVFAEVQGNTYLTYAGCNVEVKQRGCYTTYKASFSSSMPSETSGVQSQRLDNDPSNLRAATSFINSLDFEKYDDIKIECLNHINNIVENGGVITEYTIFIPDATRTVNPTIDYYGTYNGRNYYYNYYAEASYELLKNTQRSTTILRDFVSATVDFCVGLLGNTIVIPYTVVKTCLGMPGNYTVRSGDYVESKIKVFATLRGIYCMDSMRKYGSDPYAFVRLYTGEVGTARPYMVWHYSTTSGNPEESGWISDAVNCATPDYHSSSATMAKCETIYLQGLSAHEYLSTTVSQGAGTWWENL